MPGLMFTLTTEWNKVQLAEGRFYTRLYRGLSEFQVYPFMAWVNNIQYDTQSAVLGWQSRYRWILQSGQRHLFRLQPQLAGRPAAGEPVPFHR